MKAVTKFSVGTINRWKVITDYLGGRTQKEVIKKAKELSEKRAEEVKANQAAAAAAAANKTARP